MGFYGIPLLAFSQSSAEQHIILSANLADVSTKEQPIYSKALTCLLDGIREPFTLLYAGDVTDQDYRIPEVFREDSTRIHRLLSTASSYPQGQQIVLPGDRDWLSSRTDGWEQAKRVEQLIEGLPIDRLRWTPDKGCPGPRKIELNDHLLLIILNTQWWNHPHDKPGPTDADCKLSRDADFFEELASIIEEAVNKNVVLVGHYPIFSEGEYSGPTRSKTSYIPPDRYQSFFIGSASCDWECICCLSSTCWYLSGPDQ